MNAKKTNKNLSTFGVLRSLLKLVHGMECWMILAILAGTAGFVCAAGIGMMAVLVAFSHIPGSISISFGTACLCMGLFAVLRGVLRYGEQGCNHYIAFRLLATIRDKVFGQLRRLGPARLDGRKKGDLIALITSDVELLEVFYAHTISPFCIAICCAVLFGAAGFWIHWSIGVLLLCSYALAAFGIPLIFGSAAQKTGIARRKAVGDLSATVLESVRGADEIIQYDLEGVRKARMNEKTEELLVLEDEQKNRPWPLLLPLWLSLLSRCSSCFFLVSIFTGTIRSVHKASLRVSCSSPQPLDHFWRWPICRPVCPPRLGPLAAS
ncbi:ABC transporter transmembrane domain-containing protein [uncultured Allobaculum sp.]|uniref:ABC transporter transmembrane domain-containing protein n=1 Tax=uncultured Allobaculum sp. TaxID=1187017 RepID=UPI0025953E4B|nr:ABC transporter transmembrane domain-containing protein [uncultured Allobaculum sp.]